MLTNQTISEMVRIIREKDRMCKTYECAECRAASIDCDFYSANKDLSKLIQIVDAWSIEHPEKEKQVEVKKEQSCGNNALEERVDHLKKCFDEMNERLTCFIHDTVDEVQAIKKHAEHQDEFMKTKCVHVDSEENESMNEPKRTNKDVLLASFPNTLMDDNGIPYACPNRLDAHYNCDKFENCLRCRNTHWLAEVEE